MLWVFMTAYIRVFVSDFNTFTTLLNDTVKKNVALSTLKEKAKP